MISKEHLITLLCELVALSGFTVGMLDTVNTVLELIILILGLTTGWIAFWRTIKERRRKKS